MDILRNANCIVAAELRDEAKAAIERGERVEYHIESVTDTYVGPVETLVLANGRAGQVTNGNASWGDWDAARQLILLDDLDGDGKPITVQLDSALA